MVFCAKRSTTLSVPMEGSPRFASPTKLICAIPAGSSTVTSTCSESPSGIVESGRVTSETISGPARSPISTSASSPLAVSPFTSSADGVNESVPTRTGGASSSHVSVYVLGAPEMAWVNVVS